MSKALDNFTEGIKHLIQTAIDKAPFDKTYKGRVLSVANGEYTVLINGKEYPNTPVQGGGGFAVDEVVKVVFPQNNPNLRYIMGTGTPDKVIVYDSNQNAFISGFSTTEYYNEILEAVNSGITVRCEVLCGASRFYLDLKRHLYDVYIEESLFGFFTSMYDDNGSEGWWMQLSVWGDNSVTKTEGTFPLSEY